ncbi:hypothetical protein SAMN05216276_110226 [Streptosporangium subroseum]|uniref:Uncharacterized protein n=1 Tax=Streptosporangium subroseum TaxID=106412 RepID=A0A239P9H0_9ACTN|nr:hypothetical protein SAMN05216276_110226 [Streptosporangium subroseum]
MPAVWHADSDSHLLDADSAVGDAVTVLPACLGTHFRDNGMSPGAR